MVLVKPCFLTLLMGCHLLVASLGGEQRESKPSGLSSYKDTHPMHEGLGSVLTHPWEMALLLQAGEKEEKALLFVLFFILSPNPHFP